MTISRRSFLAGVSMVGALSSIGQPASAEQPLKLSIAARSRWLPNQVAITSKGAFFLGLPRHDAAETNPSLARKNDAGVMVPFPGNAWNEWKPGDDGQNSFVYLNSVHIFADDTIWCVDQGSLQAGAATKDQPVPKPGAQKLVQLNAETGAILKILRFDEGILPPGAKINDIRFYGSLMYLTDSGLGAIIIHDLASGKTARRLSGRRPMMASPATVSLNFGPGDKKTTFSPPNSDMIEITRDGRWLYWAAPTGPLYRIETVRLWDMDISDDDLEGDVQHVADIEFSGGCAMDSLGNFYFSETNTRHIGLLSPSGRTTVLASDPTLMRPDGSFIDKRRRLYMPVKQKQADNRGGAFVVYSVDLPKTFDGIALGDAVTGVPA